MKKSRKDGANIGKGNDPNGKEFTMKTIPEKRAHLKSIVGSSVNKLNDEQIIWAWSFYILKSFK